MADKLLLQTLTGQPTDRVPFWFLRQAGRYLPEYRDLRQKSGGFLDMVYKPKVATEITLQPIRRFQPDAAILFSDILVVPHALGQKLWFETGEGPRLDPVTNAQDLAALKPENSHTRFDPIFETVARLSQDLPDPTTLIGFAGAPWTVATYMVAGQGTKDQGPARVAALITPDFFTALIDLLVATTTDYLRGQIKAGAEVVMLFDSWAGALPPDEFARWVVAPNKRIIDAIRADHPDIPVIFFPRGAGFNLAQVASLGANAIHIDETMPVGRAVEELPDDAVFQGNLDPRLVQTGGDVMLAAAERLLTGLAGRGHIFNLGHGMVPEINPDHVHALSDQIRAFRRRA